MKYLSLITIMLAVTFQSCQPNSQVQKSNHVDTVTTKDADTLNDTVSTNNSNIKRPAVSSIFMIDTYRIFEESEDPSTILNENWLDLYEENGQYYLAKVDYEIEDGYSECAGVPTKSVISKRNSILFLNFPFLKEGKIENLKIIQGQIWPNDNVLYTFNNQQYQLKGYGKINSTSVQTNEKGHEEVFHDVENYKLTYSANRGKEINMLQVDSFNDTFIKTLFVGDIDRDGKLDFIISNPTNYEENGILLILSSQIKDNDIEKSSFQQRVQFDC